MAWKYQHKNRFPSQHSGAETPFYAVTYSKYIQKVISIAQHKEYATFLAVLIAIRQLQLLICNFPGNCEYLSKIVRPVFSFNVLN